MSKCYVCGATSFRKVIERDSGGAMSHLGRFACDGCGMVFADRQVWTGALKILSEAPNHLMSRRERGGVDSELD